MPTPQRLPIVNSDDGVWGDIIRQYIMKEHFNDDTDNPDNGGHKNITVRAGTTTAAPITLNSGSLLTTPAIGAIEFNGDKLYFTQTTGVTRKTVAIYDDTSGATGDIYYRNSGGDFTRLGIGSASSVLTVSGGLPAWQAPGATFSDSSFTLQDNGDSSKQLQFELSGITASTTRTLTVPDANTTIVGTTTTQTLTNKTLTDPKINAIKDTNGNNSLTISASSSAVNSIIIDNAATGSSPSISASGSDANVDLVLNPKGTGRLRSGVVNIVTTSSTDTLTNKTLTSPTLTTPRFASGGSINDNNGNEQIVFTTTASAVNEIGIINAATGNAPQVTARGGDANVSLNLVSKGTGTVRANNVDVVTTTGTQTLTNKTLTTPVIDSVKDTNSNTIIGLTPVASAVNFINFNNQATGSTPVLNVSGSDTNIGINIRGKGTGLVGFQDPTTLTKVVRLDPSGVTTARVWGFPDAASTFVGTDASQTLTNKTIDATNNTLSNIAVSHMAGSAVVTEAEGISSNDNDTTLPTSAAVKDYVDVNASPMTWSEVTGTTQTAVIKTGYIINNASLVTVTLPATAAIGSIVRIVGKGAGGWRVAQNSGQTIHFGNMNTTTGTGGRLDSTHRYDTVELVCITANTDWVVSSSVGNIGVT